MTPGRQSRVDRVTAWLAGALLCLLAGHTPAQGSGPTDRESLAALSNSQTTEPIPSSSSISGDSLSLFVPVILAVSGQNDSLFASELTLTNRGGEEATLVYTYTAHAGGGSGTATDTLPPGQQKIARDAFEYLRHLGMPIPGGGNRLGTLRVEVSGSSEVGVWVRTTTVVPDGRAGLAYPGIAAASGFTEAVHLCGLRQNTQDRSNMAFQHMGTPEQGNLTLRTTMFSGDPSDPTPRVLKDVTLHPGGFHQYNGILNGAGLDNGYVRVERVEGTAPFYAYGVINDNFNSDGSFVFPVTATSLMGTRGQTLPVIVETGVFTSELTLTNFSDVAKTVDFRFRAEAVRTPDETATLEWTLQPGQQVIVPDIVEVVRQRGTGGIGSTGATVAGALFATVASGDMSGIVIGARTSVSDGRGGQYGVFYHAVPDGEAFTDSAWVDALQQNEENRSNLALVNTGEVDDSPSVFELDIYDGATGMLANTVTGVRVTAGGWHQINAVLADYSPDTTQGYVRIRKISGTNPFLAYGVINDGGAPGERSGDGAYLPAREAIHDPGTEPMSDREVLEALYHATGGPDWINNTNWLSDAPLSEWFEVETDGSGRVTRLNLSGNGLSGTIPPELGRLTQLQELNLSRNELSGGIPPQLGGLSNLQWLGLSGNKLGGGIPLELGGLIQLQGLTLWRNQLSGAIPPELGGLANLQRLILGSNKLRGGIPAELGGLTQLQELNLRYSQLSGAIPKHLQQLSKLMKLDIRSTNICVPADAAFQVWLDTIPRFFSSELVCDGTRRVLFSASRYGVREGESVTVSVRLIDQTQDPLQSAVVALTARPGGGATAADYSGVPERVTIMGPANEAVFAVTAVEDDNFDHGETIMLSFRRPLPPGITAGDPETATVEIQDPGTEGVTDREVLEALYYSTGGLGWINRTNWLSAAPLSEWHGVGTDGSGRVTELALSRNGLSGTIPSALSHLSQLERLNLQHNELSGEIPPELAGLTHLRNLDLGRNQLTGMIPPELAGLIQLQVLNLRSNQLNGRIPPELTRLTHLRNLDLGRNQLTGTIPPELAGLIQLQVLNLGSNQLNGRIPPELAGLTQLQELQLAVNQLGGEIPLQLGQLTQLQEMGLGDNQLSGEIPTELGRLTNLQGLDLAYNHLIGSIPPELAGLTNLQLLYLSVNQLTGGIPPELGGLTQLQVLSLNSNDLIGSIPPELAGQTSLRSLSLAGNDLIGSIPPELAGLTNLRSLRLGSNPDLTGTMPPGLQQLRLSTLDLMATSVCVPEGGEFQTWLERIERYTPSGLTCGRPADAMSSIDIMVVYTPSARSLVGGTSEIEANIDLMIAETNQAYLDSGVNQQLVLVAREEVEYTESGSVDTDLARLASASDGYMDEVHIIRDQAGADLVHLISTTSGLAYVAKAFASTCSECGSWIFAHELGHNMGLSHDRYEEDNGLFPYSHGYVNQRALADGAPRSAKWRTIMAYPDQCSDTGFGSCDWIMRFSNPNQTYLGDPLGVPGDKQTRAVDGPADAVRALNHTRHSVASFRLRASENRLTMPTTVTQVRPRVRAAGQPSVLLPGDGLFRTLPPNQRGATSQQAGSALARATLRQRQVSVNIGMLERLPASGSTALTLNLFDDVVLLGIIERRTSTYSGGFALSGPLVRVPAGSVTLVVNGSVVAGSVRIPGGTFRIRPDGAGRHAIIEIDPSRLPLGCQVVRRMPGSER